MVPCIMTRLRDEIKQSRPFGSLEQEAYLSLGRTWSVLEHGMLEALRPHFWNSRGTRGDRLPVLYVFSHVVL